MPVGGHIQETTVSNCENYTYEKTAGLERNMRMPGRLVRESGRSDCKVRRYTTVLTLKKVFHGDVVAQPGFSRGFGLGLALMLLILGSALGFRTASEIGASSPAAGAAVAGANSPAELSRGFETVAGKVQSAVVNINTEQIIHNATTPLEDPFRGFFDGQDPFAPFTRQMPRDLKQKSLGSGFFVDPSGYILTNNHVVEHASSIKVKLDDGRVMDAKVVGTDPQTDIAVVKVDGSGFPMLQLGNSDQVKVGDWVLAFGSPFGLQKTMTAGIISAKGRVIGAGPYDNFLQTDAAINPGNSGGPLVDLNGQVIGINTMIASDNGSFQGIGFAIPASMAGRVYGQLVKTGKVTRGWLGVTIQSMTPELAKSFHVAPEKGVLIADVTADSPASRAGLQSGDVVVEYNGRELHNSNDLSLAVAETQVGVPAKLKVLRDGKEMVFDVKVGERPAEGIEQATAPRSGQERGKLGVTVENVSPEVARQMHLPSPGGALVTEIRPGSPSEEAGLQPGDVIRGVNQATINNASDLVAATRDLKSGDTVRLKVVRNGQTLFLAFDLS
jgi:serine protease Do